MNDSDVCWEKFVLLSTNLFKQKIIISKFGQKILQLISHYILGP